MDAFWDGIAEDRDLRRGRVDARRNVAQVAQGQKSDFAQAPSRYFTSTRIFIKRTKTLYALQ
jgi:hypothetical protein